MSGTSTRAASVEAARAEGGRSTKPEAAGARDSNDATSLWSEARALIERGRRAELDHDRGRAREAYAHAIRSARRAVSLAPDVWQSHLELASALDRAARLERGRERLRLAGEVRAEAERAVALNPLCDRSHHVLGRWHREMAGLSRVERATARFLYGGAPAPGSLADAIAHLERAVELDPRSIGHRVELARAYLDAGRRDDAFDAVRAAAALPARHPLDLEDVREAGALAARLER